MAKVLKTAALIVGAVALVATGVGAAAFGVGLATAAATVSVAGISAGTLFLAAAGLSVAAGLLAKKPTIGAGGSQTAFKADPSAGIPMVIGRTGTAGNIVFRGNADGWSDKTPNDLSDFVVVQSLGPVQSFESFTADRAGIGTFAGFMFLASQLGATPEASALAVAAGTSPRPSAWGTDAKLSGLAASQWRLRFDAKGKHFQNGTPKPLWVILGVKVYDPRLDSTYPGGSGACRANDESTWVYSENPYLHALAWLLGRHQNGVRVMGVGMPTNAIDIPAFVEGANIADTNGWTCGGVVYSTDAKWDVLKAILQAGAGEPLRLGARISCLVQTPRVSLATIGIDDLAPGTTSVQATQPQRDRINGVIPRYRSEDHEWEVVPGAPIRVSGYVTEDGGQRTREVDYPLVQVAAGGAVEQPAVLARYEIENAREFGPISIPLKLRWMGYKPGDCVTANLPEDGLNNQLILLLNRSLEPGSGTVTMTARSETTAKHAFALGQTTTAPPTPSVSGPPLVPTPAAGDWSIAGTSISSGGVTVPALKISGTTPTSIEQIVFEYRVYTGAGMDPEAGWAAAGLETPNATTKTISTVASGTPYQVAVSYRARGATGGRLILGPSTTDAYGGVTGGTGPAGLSNAIVYAYQRSSSGAPALPSATATYDFGTKALTGLNNGWSATVPAGTATLYITAATASANTSSDTIASGEWAAAQVWSSAGAPGDPGAPGLNSATVTLWQRNNTGVAPSAPSITTTYTFATAVLATPNNGWTQAAPDPSGGKYLFVTTATALSTSSTDTIASGEWAAPARFVKDGEDGSPGDPGSPGVSALGVSCLPVAITVACLADGTPKAAVPGFSINVSQSGTDVTSSATYGAVSSSGLSGTIVVSSSGVVSGITGMTADNGYIEVPISYGGATEKARVGYSKVKDALAYASDTDNTLTGGIGTGYSEIARNTLLAGPNGSFTCSYNCDAIVNGSTSASLQTYMEFSLNGTTWSAVSSSQNSGTFPVGEDCATFDSASFSGASVSLSAKQTIYVRLMAKRTGSGTFPTISGSLTTQWNG